MTKTHKRNKLLKIEHPTAKRLKLKFAYKLGSAHGEILALEEALAEARGRVRDPFELLRKGLADAVRNIEIPNFRCTVPKII